MEIIILECYQILEKLLQNKKIKKLKIVNSFLPECDEFWKKAIAFLEYAKK